MDIVPVGINPLVIFLVQVRLTPESSRSENCDILGGELGYCLEFTAASLK